MLYLQSQTVISVVTVCDMVSLQCHRHSKLQERGHTSEDDLSHVQYSADHPSMRGGGSLLCAHNQ